MSVTGATKRPRRRARVGIAALCVLVALLAGAATKAGLFLRGDESFAPTVSVRGEHYAMATDGVYAYNSARMVAEGVGWDIVTLVFAVPALLLAVPSLLRGSLRGRLFAVGVLAYLFYQYLMYSVAWAFGPLLLLFVAIYALSLVAIVWIVSTLSLQQLRERASSDFPRRGMAVLCFAVAGLLLLMWLRLIVAAGTQGVQGLLRGQTTFVVQALDLGLIVPLALFTGLAAWRGAAVGYLLCSAVAVKAFAMATAICAMLLSAWSYEGRLEVVPLALFAVIAMVTVVLGTRMFRSLSPSPADP